jgi:predicted ATPase
VLAECAADRPLAVLVDDLHWLDTDSRDALLFAVRRLRADAVAVLATTRLDAGADPTTAGLPDLTLDGLTIDELTALLADDPNPRLRSRPKFGRRPAATPWPPWRSPAG